MEAYLLPAVVAIVIGLSVSYLVFRLFASPSSAKPQGTKPGSGKKQRQASTKKPAAGKKKVNDKKQTKPAAEAKKQKPNKKAESDSENAAPAAPSKAADDQSKKTKGKKKSKSGRKKVERVPSAENLSDFLPIDVTKDKDENATEQASAKKRPTGEERINAAREDPLAEGWEIVGLRKKEWKDAKRKEREVELEKERKELEDKAKTEAENKEKREAKRGGREKREGGVRDRPRGPKGTFVPGKNRKNEDKDKEQKVPVVSEKTRRREEITINGIQFAKFKDEEEENEDWDLLSETIENGSSSSDDIAPLRTAHLEMRYYSTPKESVSPSPKKKVSEAKASQEAWTPAAGELSKYNYTQGSKKDEEKEEGQPEHSSLGTWEARQAQSSGLVDDKTAELVEAFIKALGHPFTSNLAKVELSSKGKPQRYLIQTEIETLRSRLLKLLSSGVSLEPPVCGSQSEAAEFVERLLAYLETPFVCLTNEQHSSDGSSSKGAKFWRKGFGDEGFFIISRSKIVMIWFIGHD